MSSMKELSVSERQRRQAQQDRDEMADEMVNFSGGKSVSRRACPCVVNALFEEINVAVFV